MKLNIGCGSNLVKGFVNMDKFYPHKDVKVGDILDTGLKPDSVDYIICDQVLEHLKMADIIPALYEMRRILKKGGKCVIIVPDFEDAVKQWLAQDHNGAFEPMKYHWLSEVIYGNQLHDGEFHKTPMCAGFLHNALNVAGLTKHEISFFPAFGAIPVREGMRPYAKNAVLRNAQLVCDITKT